MKNDTRCDINENDCLIVQNPPDHVGCSSIAREGNTQIRLSMLDHLLIAKGTTGLSVFLEVCREAYTPDPVRFSPILRHLVSTTKGTFALNDNCYTFVLAVKMFHGGVERFFIVVITATAYENSQLRSNSHSCINSGAGRGIRTHTPEDRKF